MATEKEHGTTEGNTISRPYGVVLGYLYKPRYKHFSAVAIDVSPPGGITRAITSGLNSYLYIAYKCCMNAYIYIHMSKVLHTPRDHAGQTAFYIGSRQCKKKKRSGLRDYEHDSVGGTAKYFI